MAIDNPFGPKPPIEVPKPEIPELKIESPKPPIEAKEEEPTKQKNPVLRKRGLVVKSESSGKALTKADVLKQYNYIESDIPINHPYWKLKS